MRTGGDNYTVNFAATFVLPAVAENKYLDIFHNPVFRLGCAHKPLPSPAPEFEPAPATTPAPAPAFQPAFASALKQIYLSKLLSECCK